MKESRFQRHGNSWVDRGQLFTSSPLVRSRRRRGPPKCATKKDNIKRRSGGCTNVSNKGRFSGLEKKLREDREGSLGLADPPFVTFARTVDLCKACALRRFRATCLARDQRGLRFGTAGALGGDVSNKDIRMADCRTLLPQHSGATTMLYTVACVEWFPGSSLSPAMTRGRLFRTRAEVRKLGTERPILAVFARYDAVRGEVVAENSHRIRAGCGAWAASAITDDAGNVTVLAEIPAALVQVVGPPDFRLHDGNLRLYPQPHRLPPTSRYPWMRFRVRRRAIHRPKHSSIPGAVRQPMKLRAGQNAGVTKPWFSWIRKSWEAAARVGTHRVPGFPLTQGEAVEVLTSEAGVCGCEPRGRPPPQTPW